jgi:hypothetical protein
MKPGQFESHPIPRSELPDGTTLSYHIDPADASLNGRRLQHKSLSQEYQHFVKVTSEGELKEDPNSEKIIAKPPADTVGLLFDIQESWVEVVLVGFGEGWMKRSDIEIQPVLFATVLQEKFSSESTAPVSGYKTVKWGEKIAQVESKLPPERSVSCAVTCTREGGNGDNTPFCSALHMLQSTEEKVASHGLFGEDHTKTIYEELLNPVLYADEKAHRSFSVKPVSSGCGLFYEGRYLAQINWVNKELDDRATTSDFAQHYGQPKDLGEQSSQLIEGKLDVEYQAYRFQNNHELLYALFLKPQIAAKAGEAVTAYVNEELAKTVLADAKGRAFSREVESELLRDSRKQKSTKALLRNL